LPHYDTCPDCGGPTTIAWEGDGEIVWSCEICRGEGVPPELTTADMTAPRVDPEPTKLSTPNVYIADTPQERVGIENPDRRRNTVASSQLLQPILGALRHDTTAYAPL
jgi:hypothetical protein